MGTRGHSVKRSLVTLLFCHALGAATAPITKPFLYEDFVDSPQLQQCLKELFIKYAPLGFNNVRGFFGPYLGKPRTTAEYRVLLRQPNQQNLNVRMVFQSEAPWSYTGYYNAQQEFRIGASNSAMEDDTDILDLDGRFLFSLDLSDCRRLFR